MNEERFTIHTADWKKDRSALQMVRLKVFVEEQGVPLDLEWDGEDDTAIHLLAVDAELNPIGTARLLPSGQIGRMAVLEHWRRRGVGGALLKQLLVEAQREAFPSPFLNAQLSALEFYEKSGFQAVDEIFYEAGIPHQRMIRRESSEQPAKRFS